VLLLDERGYIMDDGLICRERADRFYVTLTSAGASVGEMWIRDWAESQGFDVRLLNQTQSLGAINVTGPHAAELLARAGVERLPGFARHGVAKVSGVACRILRLSFTGELSFELHHAAADSVRLWRALLEHGQDLGIHPHGMDVLFQLRLEKGHVIVGQDTDFDSTPRRIHHEWAVRLDKPEFLGRQAVIRTNNVPLDRQLVGLEMALPAPMEGAVVWNGSEYAGYVTSSGTSHRLGKAVMLAWIRLANGQLPDKVTINGRTARRAQLPFYDPGNERPRAKVAGGTPEPFTQAASRVSGTTERMGRFERLEATRLVASPEVLDRIGPSPGILALRVAPDELLVTPSLSSDALDDSHAIAERETGFAAAWVALEEATSVLERACAWVLPTERPAFAQGAVAGIPVKLWFEEERVLFVVPAPYAADLEERMA
jgi:glycine cleavage system aminomethyltransferase T